MSFLLWTSFVTCTGCLGNLLKYWKALTLQLLPVCTSLQSGMRKESWAKMHNWSWLERVSASSSLSPFSPVSLLFIMDLTQSTLVTDRIIALKYTFHSQGNVKSDYFQWQKIDDFGRAVFNLLIFVFFDIFSAVITCLVVNFTCRINLLKVSR